jgi:hypothetical protein
MNLPKIDLSSVKLTPSIDKSATKRKLFHWNDDASLTLRLDWSSLSAFLDCNRKGKHLLVDAKVGSKSVALIFGAAIHSGLEALYRAQDLIGSDLLNQRIQRVIDEEFANSPVSLFDDYRTPDYAYEVIRKYQEHYKGEKLHPVEHNGMPLVEFGFAVPISKFELDPSVFRTFGELTNSTEHEKFAFSTGSPVKVTVEWTGVIDLVSDVNGEVWLTDHKTTSIFSADFTEGFENAPQPLGYLHAINQLLGVPAKGFMLNGLICRKETKTGKGIEFTRRYFTYAPWQFEEFLHDITYHIEEFINNLYSGYFPARRAACLTKFGKCPYFDTCSLPPEQRSLHLNSGVYADNVWKPV